MSVSEVDDYLAGAPEPHRSTLETIRAMLRSMLPDAEEGIAYGVPCLTVAGTRVAGFGWSRDHLTYFPMSGSITAELADDLVDYVTAKGSLRFATDVPLPRDLVQKLVDARIREIARIGR